MEFENSLFYPCSAFDGFILRAVNSCTFDNQNIDLDVNHYIYLDHGHFSKIDSESIKDVKNLYDSFCDELISINNYTFENINFNQITENLYSDYLISIDELLPIINDYYDARENFIQAGNVAHEENENTFILNAQDYELAFEFNEHDNYHNLFETIKENKKIVFCAKGTINEENLDDTGKEVIFLTFIIDDAIDFYHNFLNNRKITPKVLVMKMMAGIEHEYIDFLNNHHFNPAYVIAENHTIPNNYNLICPFHQGWLLELGLYLRNDSGPNEKYKTI